MSFFSFKFMITICFYQKWLSSGGGTSGINLKKKSCPFIILSSSARQPVRLFLLAAAQLSACHWPPNPCWPPLVPTSNNPTLPRSVFWCSLFMQVLVGVLLKPLTSLRLFPTQPSPPNSIFSKQPNFALITLPPLHGMNRAGTSF